MFKQLFLAGGLCLAAVAPAPAQAVRDESPVVVTARGYAQTADATLADVTVIDRAAIEASGAADLRDLLRLQAGIDMPRAGGPGTQVNVFLRGTNSNHVLVLINGVRVASLNTGAYAWEQLPLDAVERIEIVRGPRAAVWGSDAIGGVIQIFTRRIDGTAAALRYGSHADAAGSAGLGQWHNGQGFSIEAGIRHVRGFSAQNPRGYSYNPDDDGLHSVDVTARGAWQLGSQRLSAQALLSDAHVQFDQGASHVVEQIFGASMQGPLASFWKQRLSLGSARERLSTPVYANLFRSRRRSLDWRNRFDLGHGQQLVAGLSLLHEHGESIDTSGNGQDYAGSRRTCALYAGWYGNAGRLDWQLAGRHDASNRFGSADTASAGLGLRLADRWRLVGSWGQGFRAPNLNEQFSPGYGGYYAGNPELRPERSRTAELSLEWSPSAALRLKLARYRTRIDQLISFTHGPLMQAGNIARARIDGTSLTAHWQAAPWSMDASADWLDPRDLGSGALLLRRPRHKATLALARGLSPRLQVGVEALAVGPRQDVGGPLAGYAVVGLHADWTLGASQTLRLRVDNVLDRGYTELRGFNTPGRSLWLTWAWRH